MGSTSCSHSYSAVVTAPTCTGQGYTTYTCVLCGDSYVGSYTSALGHNYVNGLCTRCGATDPSYVSGTCNPKEYNIYYYVPSATENNKWEKYQTETGTRGSEHKALGEYPYIDQRYFAGWSYDIDPTSYDLRPGDTFELCPSAVSGEESCVALYAYYIDYADVISGDPVLIYDPDDFADSAYRLEPVSHAITRREKHESVSNWSEWTTDSISASHNVEVETNVVYRYYYFLCNKCGDHNPLSGNCGCGGTSNDGYVIWLPIPYTESNSSVVSYATYKRQTTSLGDGMLWYFSAGNLNDTAVGTIDSSSAAVIISNGYRSRTYTSITSQKNETVTAYTAIANHVHSMSHLTAQAATCTQSGNKEYWYCADCGKYFLDAAATTETTLSAVTVAALGHSYVNGLCTRCGATDPSYVSGTCGDDLKWRLNTDTGVLTISGTGAMAYYSSSESAETAPWYDYRGSITQVVIGYGVTTIGAYAFVDCDSLASVSIPRSVIEIGYDAFDNCTSLTSVTIPDSVTSIGSHAFYSCRGLTSVTISSNVTSLGTQVFYDCTSLKHVTIPSSVTSIGAGAFGNCTSLASVTIPDSVTSIGSNAFYGCTSLTSVTIPDSVTEIGAGPFGGCRGLQAISVDAANSSYTSIDGVLFSKDMAELVQYPIGNSRTSYSIPSSVKTIGGNAFDKCNTLTSVTIPSSVTSIGYAAFYSCSALTDVYYGGTSEQWSAISIDESYNEPLTSATIHYAGCAHSSLSRTAAKAATCTQSGNKEYWYCADCEKYFLDAAATTETTLSAVTVAALGHSYVNGSCTRCGATDPSYVPDGSVGRVIVREARGCPGDTVSITIALENNPGIITMILEVGYDASVMTLTGVTDGGILGTAMHTDKLTMDPYQLTWNNGTAPSNFTAVGDLVTLTFTIAEDAAEGSYDITLSCSDALNYDMDEVRFLTVGSTLTVTNVLPGDVNGDGVVSIKDSVFLQRYIAKIDGYDATTVDLLAADVNGDGVVNIKDSIILQRYVAKWAGYEALPYTN